MVDLTETFFMLSQNEWESSSGIEWLIISAWCISWAYQESELSILPYFP